MQLVQRILQQRKRRAISVRIVNQQLVQCLVRLYIAFESQSRQVSWLGDHPLQRRGVGGEQVEMAAISLEPLQ